MRLVDEHSNEVVPLGHVRDLADDAQEGDVRFQGRAVIPMLTASSAWTRGGCRLQYQVMKGYE